MIENNNEENENNASVDQLIGLKSIKDIIHMREDLELEEEANSPDMKAEQIDGEDENPTEFHANGKVHIFSWRSLFIFGHTNKFRLLVIYIITHKLFD